MKNLNGVSGGYITSALRQVGGVVKFKNWPIADLNTNPVTIFVKKKKTELTDLEIEDVKKLIGGDLFQYVQIDNPVRKKSDSKITHKTEMITVKGRKSVIHVPIDRAKYLIEKYGSVKNAILSGL